MAEYDAALFIVNEAKDQITGLVRSVMVALEDDKVSVSEGIGLAMRAVMLSQTMMSVLKDMSHEEVSALLYVLEHADFVLPV